MDRIEVNETTLIISEGADYEPMSRWPNGRIRRAAWYRTHGFMATAPKAVTGWYPTPMEAARALVKVTS